LEHHPNVALPRGQSRDIAIANPNLASCRFDQTRNHPQSGGLPASGGTEQHKKFTVLYTQAKVLNGRVIPVAFRDSFQRDARHDLNACYANGRGMAIA
jgi:hypothetical protein